MNRLEPWLSIGLGILAFGLAGCPSADVGGGQNTNDNDNTSHGNDNGDDEVDGPEAGVEIPIPNEPGEHVPVGQQVIYQTNPPASGAHWDDSTLSPVAAGVYESALEEEQWVHNLDHGYIVILYDCDGECPPTLIDDLQGFFDATPPSEIFGNIRLVISPYDGLPHALTIIAWDWQLHLTTFDESALRDFYDRHVDQGPEMMP